MENSWILCLGFGVFSEITQKHPKTYTSNIKKYIQKIMLFNNLFKADFSSSLKITIKRIGG